MRIIVSGGLGFIGSALIRHLINNTEHKVLNIDKETYAAMPEALAQVENDENNKQWWSSILNTTHQSRRLGLMK